MNRYLKIINNYGVNAQLKQLNEEVYEFEEAVLEKHNKEHITEEISDVFVILSQFIIKFDLNEDKIMEIMEQKVNRQIKRMEKNKIEKLIKKVDDIVENIDTDYLLKKLDEEDKSDYEIYFEDKKGE